LAARGGVRTMSHRGGFRGVNSSTDFKTTPLKPQNTHCYRPEGKKELGGLLTGEGDKGGVRHGK